MRRTPAGRAWRAWSALVRDRVRRGRGELGRNVASYGLATSMLMGSTLFMISGDEILGYFGFGGTGGSGACATSLGGYSGNADADSIPENFLEIAKQAGKKFDIPWEYVAGISWQETNHGRIADTANYGGLGRLPTGIVYGTANPAGAAGPLQFGIKHPKTGATGGPMGDAANTWGGEADQPASERTAKPGSNGQWFGIDGNGDGRVNVWDPADALPSAAGFMRYWMDRGHSLEWAIGRYHGSGQGGAYQVSVSNKASQYRGGNFKTAPPNGTQGDCSDTALNGTAIEKVIQFARKQTGKPYIWGGVGDAGYDCSGLLVEAYKKAGLPKEQTGWRWTTSQMHAIKGVKTVSLDSAQAGDMILTGSGSTPTHVSMVTSTKGGKLTVIEAYSSNVPLPQQISEHEFDTSPWRQSRVHQVIRVSHLFPSDTKAV